MVAATSQPSFSQLFERARNAGVPLLAVETTDEFALARSLKTACNENPNWKNNPFIVWDCVTGPHTIDEDDERSQAAILRLGQSQTDMQEAAFFVSALSGNNEEDHKPRLVANTLVLMLGAKDWLGKPHVKQGIKNLRDQFKRNGRTLVLLSPDFELGSLQDDVILLEESLPDEEAILAMIDKLDKATNLAAKKQGLTREPTSLDIRKAAMKAVIGLPPFVTEQILAMNMRRKDIDVEGCWLTKKKQIEMTRGLSLYRGGEKFADLGGLDHIKEYLSSIMKGKNQPEIIVWLDEVEKTGLANRQDTSGVNQDQEGTLLTYMEDYDVFGVMLLGVPGAGKSAICKAVGSEFDRVVIRLDLGAIQDQYVGASQNNLRRALKMITAIGGKSTLWLATSNSIEGLSGAMRQRFVDTFFFDLPDRDERLPIWKIWMERKGLTGDTPYTSDEGWVGRNIAKCCDKAFRRGSTIEDAARWITPVAVTAREDIKSLRLGAHRRYLSATHEGLYEMPKPPKGGKENEEDRAFVLS